VLFLPFSVPPFSWKHTARGGAYSFLRFLLRPPPWQGMKCLVILPPPSVYCFSFSPQTLRHNSFLFFAPILSSLSILRWALLFFVLPWSSPQAPKLINVFSAFLFSVFFPLFPPLPPLGVVQIVPLPTLSNGRRSFLLIFFLPVLLYFLSFRP